MNILITGGANGLGEAITEKLACSEKYHVYFTYNRSKDKATELESKHSKTTAIHCDFTSDSSIDNLLERLPELDIDVLVNNALTGFHKKHFHKLSPDLILKSFEENVIPTIKITQRVLKLCRKKSFGKIITILSSAIINKPPIGWSEYAANKSYLLSLSKSWATENTGFNITSNCISPSMMMTDLTSDIDQRILENYQENHSLKQILTIDEVADSVEYLVNASQHINGINLIINSAENVV